MKNCNGQAMVEYMFLIGIIAAALISMLLLSQDVLSSLFNSIAETIRSII
jgi:Flp pilus assembly pilin Flp